MTISATKPSVAPRWASVSPGTSRLEPTSGQKDTGWTNGQRPAFNEMNWLQGVIYDWQQYLEAATDQLESSKVDKTGAADLSGTFRPTASGGASFGTSAQPLGAVVTNQLDLRTDGVQSNFNPFFTTTYTLGSTTKRWLSGFIVTLTSTTLNTDTLNANTVNCDVVQPTAAGNGTVGLNGTPYGAAVARETRTKVLRVFDKTQPASALDTNKLSALCLPVAKGLISNASATNPTMNGGYNMLATNPVTRTGPGAYTVTFRQALANTNYTVVISPTAAALRLYRIGVQTTTSFEVFFFDTTFTAADSVFAFAVFGEAAGTDPIA